MTDAPALRAVAPPEFAALLEEALWRQGRLGLADQLGALKVSSSCRCPQRGCSSFFTVPCAEAVELERRTTWVSAGVDDEWSS